MPQRLRPKTRLTKEGKYIIHLPLVQRACYEMETEIQMQLPNSVAGFQSSEFFYLYYCEDAGFC